MLYKQMFPDDNCVVFRFLSQIPTSKFLFIFVNSAERIFILAIFNASNNCVCYQLTPDVRQRKDIVINDSFLLFLQNQFYTSLQLDHNATNVVSDLSQSSLLVTMPTRNVTHSFSRVNFHA